MTTMLNPALSRRRFIVSTATAAGGLMLGFHLPLGGAEAAEIAAQPWTSPLDGGAEVNAWLVIDPDDNVLIRVAQSEMGEGVFTAMPMIVAEELECDWSKVRAEYASANRSLREGQVYQRMATRRQRRGPALARVPATGGRQRSRTPDRGGRRAVGRARLRVPRRKQPRAPRSLRAQRQLRSDRGRRGQGRAGRGAGDQDARSVPPARQADQAFGHRAQGQRHRQLRHRHPAAGHAVRVGGYLSGVRRQAQELRLRGDQGPAGRALGGRGAGRRRRDR